jgi:SAM-dependent methyltransferase
MTLTSRLGTVVDCFPDPNGEPDLGALEFANDVLFYRIKTSGRFPTTGKVRILDVGSGMNGSDFVNRYGEMFPNAELVYLDRCQTLLKKLDRPHKVCSDATNMPFSNETFDITYAGYVVSSGILKNHSCTRDESYRIAKENYRVLKQNGLFIFTYCMGDGAQTLNNLLEIGFRELGHLQRIKWQGGIPTDTYAARK